MRSTAKRKKARSLSRGPEATPDLRLKPQLDMRAARELKERLVELLARGRPCVIDAEGVERVSTGCLQILAAFARSIAANRQTATLLKPSGALLEGFATLGLSDHLTLFRQEH